MDEFARYAMLLDFYGPLLTERQNEIMDLHFNNDLSLVEIAEQTGISRQGVYDTLKKSRNALDRYEGILGLAGGFSNQKEKVAEIMRILDTCESPGTGEIRKHMLEIYND